MSDSAILTPRLELRQLTAESMAALLDRDANQLTALTQANFSDPVCLPPLFDDNLPMLREQLAAHAQEVGWQWWPWLLVRQIDKEPLGLVGFHPIPDREKSVELGYSIYARFQGLGFATEAVKALIDWVFTSTDRVEIRATVPKLHSYSIRVLQKANLQPVDREEDPELGEILVFEISKDRVSAMGSKAAVQAT